MAAAGVAGIAGAAAVTGLAMAQNTRAAPAKIDTEEASEDYSEFEADDLEDNTDKKA